MGQDQNELPTHQESRHQMKGTGGEWKSRPSGSDPNRPEVGLYPTTNLHQPHL